MKKLIRNKKGVDSFTFLLTIFAILVLGFILVGLTMKYNKLNNTIGDAGSSASSILSTYASADKSLLFLDNAVGMSIDGAVYDLAYNGFYPVGGGECGSSGSYSLWSNGSVEPTECEAVNRECVPGNYNEFNNYFNRKLTKQLKAYNESSDPDLPNDGYEITLGTPDACSGEGCFGGTGTGPLQLVGTSENLVVVRSSRVNYNVTPSFRVNSDVDLIGDFGKVTSNAGALVGQDEGTMRNSVKAYSKGTGLKWNVESYSSGCGNGCNTGESCEICHEECEEVKVPCEGEGETGCTETSCTTICVPGVYIQYYCETNAGIGVKVPDAKYDKDEKGGDGYKSFVTSESGSPEVKEYNYRFGLNRVELNGGPVCIPI